MEGKTCDSQLDEVLEQALNDKELFTTEEAISDTGGYGGLQALLLSISTDEARTSQNLSTLSCLEAEIRSLDSLSNFHLSDYGCGTSDGDSFSSILNPEKHRDSPSAPFQKVCTSVPEVTQGLKDSADLSAQSKVLHPARHSTKRLQVARTRSNSLDSTLSTNKLVVKRLNSSPFPLQGDRYDGQSTPSNLTINTPTQSEIGDDAFLNQSTTSIVDALWEGIGHKNDEGHAINSGDVNGNGLKDNTAVSGTGAGQAHTDIGISYSQALKEELRCKIQVRKEFGDLVHKNIPKRTRRKSNFESEPPTSPKKHIERTLERKKRNKEHAKNSREKAKALMQSLLEANKGLEAKKRVLSKECLLLKKSYKKVKRLRDQLIQAHTIPRPGKFQRGRDINDNILQPKTMASLHGKAQTSRILNSGKPDALFFGAKTDGTSIIDSGKYSFAIREKNLDKYKSNNTMMCDGDIQNITSQKDNGIPYVHTKMKRVSEWVLQHRDLMRETEMDIQRSIGISETIAKDSSVGSLDLDDPSLDEVGDQLLSPWEVRKSYRELNKNEKPSTSSTPPLSVSLIRRPCRQPCLETERHIAQIFLPPVLPQSTHRNSSLSNTAHNSCRPFFTHKDTFHFSQKQPDVSVNKNLSIGSSFNTNYSYMARSLPLLPVPLREHQSQNSQLKVIDRPKPLTRHHLGLQTRHGTQHQMVTPPRHTEHARITTLLPYPGANNFNNEKPNSGQPDKSSTQIIISTTPTKGYMSNTGVSKAASNWNQAVNTLHTFQFNPSTSSLFHSAQHTSTPSPTSQIRPMKKDKDSFLPMFLSPPQTFSLNSDKSIPTSPNYSTLSENTDALSPILNPIGPPLFPQTFSSPQGRGAD